MRKRDRARKNWRRAGRLVFPMHGAGSSCAYLLQLDFAGTRASRLPGDGSTPSGRSALRRFPRFEKGMSSRRLPRIDLSHVCKVRRRRICGLGIGHDKASTRASRQQRDNMNVTVACPDLSDPAPVSKAPAERGDRQSWTRDRQAHAVSRTACTSRKRGINRDVCRLKLLHRARQRFAGLWPRLKSAGRADGISRIEGPLPEARFERKSRHGIGVEIAQKFGKKRRTSRVARVPPVPTPSTSHACSKIDSGARFQRYDRIARAISQQVIGGSIPQ